MELLKKILNQDSISKWRVPSISEKGKFHIVRLLIDGNLECDCIAGQYNRFCRHKQKVGEILTKKGIHFKAEGQMKIPRSY